jgi:hypothetical protein
MTAEGNRPLRIVSGEASTSTRRRAQWLVPALAVLALLAAIVANSSGFSERRAIRSLPEPQRRALLARTVDELKQSCGEGRPDALKDHCRELASFASRFDECRGECEALAHLQLAPVPTR